MKTELFMEQGRRETDRKRTSIIDWREVRQRLDMASESLHRGISPEKEKEILKARAQSLAREIDREDAHVERLEILEFLLASERYGIEISWVRETIPLKQFTPIPCTPPFVLGLINVRGRILSVIDIKKFFDLPDKGLTDLNKVIILHDGKMEFGILADAVQGVREIPVAELQPSLPTLTGIRKEYLKGVSEERMTVLDGARLLGDKKIIVNEETGDEGAA
jgi:purine-binding chemotaxis protein CheW